jgi:hypothetical protein
MQILIFGNSKKINEKGYKDQFYNVENWKPVTQE